MNHSPLLKEQKESRYGPFGWAFASFLPLLLGVCQRGQGCSSASLPYALHSCWAPAHFDTMKFPVMSWFAYLAYCMQHMFSAVKGRT